MRRVGRGKAARSLALVVTLLVPACAPRFDVFGGRSLCTPQTRFREAYEVALVQARRVNRDARLFYFESEQQSIDGTAQDWNFSFTWPSADDPLFSADIACGRVRSAASGGHLWVPAHDHAQADAIASWALGSDSPQWMADGGWLEEGHLVSNVNDCSGPANVKTDTPSFFFCAPEAEGGALIVGFFAGAHYDPIQQRTGGQYLADGLELWPTYRVVRLRETPIVAAE